MLCEASASQKADVAKLLVSCMKPTPVVLSIGDGPNDIPMFMETHVSISVGSDPSEEMGIVSPPTSTANGESTERMKLGISIQEARLFSDIHVPSFAYIQPLLMEFGRNGLKASA